MSSSSLTVSAWSRVRAVLEVFGGFAGLVVVAALLSTFVAPLLPPELATPILGLGMWGGVIAGWLLLRANKSGYAAIGFKRPTSWGRTLMWVLGTMIVSYGGAIGIGEIIRATTDWPPLDVTYIRGSIEGDWRAYLTWIVLVVWGSAAFGEELFGRGFLMDRLHHAFGRGRIALFIAVLAQAAIFGAMHAIQGPTGIVLTAFIGLVFAAAYYLSGRNLWAPILAHGLVDTISLTLMFLGAPLPGYIN